MAESAQFDRYEITRLLGAGGMGKVYEGIDPSQDRRVAIKVLHRQLCSQGDFRRRFLREARILANLKHKSITQFHEAGESEDDLYLVMEFVDGQTLEDCLTVGMYRSPQHALQVVRQVCEALDYAHHYGIVHRDIKPSNVMIKPSGEVMLMDFGIARADSESGITQEGQALGTPQYMSPEQCKGAKIDGRSDIYSLAIVLYEMLTGVRPFEGETFLLVVNKQVNATPSPVSTHVASIPRPMVMAISKALSKNAMYRQQTAMQFYEELAGSGAQLPKAPASGSVRAKSKPGPTVKVAQGRRRRILLGVAALAAAALVGLAGWMFVLVSQA